MGVEIRSRCNKCDLVVEIPSLDAAITRACPGQAKELVLCKSCAADFDTLMELIDEQDEVDGLLFNIWFRKGMEVGIIKNYK